MLLQGLPWVIRGQPDFLSSCGMGYGVRVSAFSYQHAWVRKKRENLARGADMNVWLILLSHVLFTTSLDL